MASGPVTSRPASYLVHSILWGRTVWISDLTKSTSFYQVKCRSHRPHYTFHDTSDAPFAYVNTNSGKSFEFTIHGQAFSIPLFSRVIAAEFKYQSPALGGLEVVWKSADVAATGEIVCTDQKGAKLGRFNQMSLGRDVGTLEFEGGAELPREVVDEMVVVGMVLAWHRLYQSAILISVAGALFSTCKG